MHKGSCLCGAVRFEIAGELPAPDACHCSQCRRQSGHYFASTDVPRSAVSLQGAQQLTWFHSSENVRRGFCRICGSALFWDPVHKDWIGVAMGAIESPTHTRLAIHVHVASKGDYYDISDDLPQRP